MALSDDNRIDAFELFQILMQTITVLFISFTHPWLESYVPEKTRMRIQKDIRLVFIFVFAISYSYTNDALHALVILGMFFGLKALMIKMYSR